jgi:hypothetical protein
MKKVTWVVSVIIGGWLVVAGLGCRKNADSAQPQTLEQSMAELRASLTSASTEARDTFYKGVTFGVRYGNYAEALEALDKIAADPSLTEPQKKLVAQVTEQLKQKANSKSAGAAEPAADPAAK